MTVAVSFLRLVRERSGAPDSKQHRFEQIQQSLLPVTERTMALCTADGLNENTFRSFIDNLTPRLILDFRTAPRFDFGTLNRGKALDIFEAIGAKYIDVGYSRLDDEKSGVNTLSEQLVEYAVPLVEGHPVTSVLAFIDAGVDFELIGLDAIQKVRARTRVVWDLLLFGPDILDEAQRNILFISHANPEDNEVAFWLQTQLTRMGYETWSDMTHLKAGELFWDSIEDTVRNKAARVIALISKKSMQKPGVLDEISLAVSIERTRNLKGFVIPVRVDDVPYSEFRANVARKNVIDFSHSWAAGFATLSTSLSHDRIPRLRQTQGASLASWWDEQRPSALSVVQEKEILTSNRFRIVSFPLRVYSFSGVPKIQLGFKHPLIPFKQQWLSFFSEHELRVIGVHGLTYESTLSANDLFSGKLGITSNLSSFARTRLLHRLLNLQWNSFLAGRGLKLYEEGAGYPVPFVPDGLLGGNTAHFFDAAGRQRKRLLVGFSVKKNMYWHLAPVGMFSTGGMDTLLNLKLRVLFSSDGQGQWPSIEKMRTMRRTFCKNWWNDRWVSLQHAFMSWLANGASELPLYSGDGGKLVIQSSAVSYESSVSIRETQSDDSDSNRMSDSYMDSEEVDDDWSEFEFEEDDDSELQEASS